VQPLRRRRRDFPLFGEGVHVLFSHTSKKINPGERKKKEGDYTREIPGGRTCLEPKKGTTFKYTNKLEGAITTAGREEKAGILVSTASRGEGKNSDIDSR